MPKLLHKINHNILAEIHEPKIPFIIYNLAFDAGSALGNYS